MIENADELMSNFAENFKDESDIVQQQILISCMKLYLHRPQDGQEILKDLFKYITKECENPDLRDRGFIYWRLLSTNPSLAKKVVLSERPLISDQSYTLETEILDKLIENIGTLSSVYGKQPEEFVKKLKDNANAKEEVEEDAEELLGKDQKEENVEFFGEKPKEEVNFATKGEYLIDNTATQQNVHVQSVPEEKKPQQDLLDMEDKGVENKVPEKKNEDIIDLTEPPKHHLYSTGVNNSQVNSNAYSTQVNSNAPINFFEN